MSTSHIFLGTSANYCFIVCAAVQLLDMYQMTVDSPLFAQLKSRNSDMKDFAQTITKVRTRFCPLACMYVCKYVCVIYHETWTDFGQSIRKLPAAELADIVAGNIETSVTEKVQICLQSPVIFCA